MIVSLQENGWFDHYFGFAPQSFLSAAATQMRLDEPPPPLVYPHETSVTMSGAATQIVSARFAPLLPPAAPAQSHALQEQQSTRYAREDGYRVSDEPGQEGRDQGQPEERHGDMSKDHDSLRSSVR